MLKTTVMEHILSHTPLHRRDHTLFQSNTPTKKYLGGEITDRASLSHQPFWKISISYKAFNLYLMKTGSHIGSGSELKQCLSNKQSFSMPGTHLPAIQQRLLGKICNFILYSLHFSYYSYAPNHTGGYFRHNVI